jgi:hypothetical protein
MRIRSWKTEWRGKVRGRAFYSWLGSHLCRAVLGVPTAIAGIKGLLGWPDYFAPQALPRLGRSVN